ncbi:hypothetical protein ABIE52_002742 [Rhodococcus sp. OAS809]
MKTRPIAMVTTPPTRIRTSRLTSSVEITPNTDAVARTNTTVKPATNSPAAPATLSRLLRVIVRVFASSAVIAGASAPTTPAR